MERTQVYDQVWDTLQREVKARAPRHVQTYVEQAFERQTKRPYRLASELREDFRRFAAAEWLRVAKLLEQHKMWQEQRSQGRVRPRRRRRPNPQTRKRAVALLVFVGRLVPVGALGRGSLRIGRRHSEIEQPERNLIVFRRSAVPWAALQKDWNAKHPEWPIASPSALKVEFYKAARDPRLASEAIALVQDELAVQSRASAKGLLERLTALQQAGILPPTEYLEQLPSDYGLFRAAHEWHTAGCPRRPPKGSRPKGSAPA